MLRRLLPQAKRNPPKLPDGLRIYAVGDIHGCADLLDHVLAGIDDHLASHADCRAIEVFLGDYVDRGPASRTVIDRLIERSLRREVVCLKGNHETFILKFLQDPSMLPYWQNVGGAETLASYGLHPTLNPDAAALAETVKSFAASLPDRHHEFLTGLAPSFTCGDFFFAHAGVRPGVPLAQQREHDLLWIRDDFLLSKDDFGKLIVHGHTPVHEPDIRANRINIDTGAYATGRLTCLVIEGDEALVL